MQLKLFSIPKQERIRSRGSEFFPLREVPILKRDAIEENNCLFQQSPLDVRTFFGVLATPLEYDQEIPQSQITKPPTPQRGRDKGTQVNYQDTPTRCFPEELYRVYTLLRGSWGTPPPPPPVWEQKCSPVAENGLGYPKGLK